MIHWQDWVALVIIFTFSYWLAFKSSVLEYFIKKKSKKVRGTITGRETKGSSGPLLKRVNNISKRMIYK